MNSNQTVEVEAATVEQAISDALAELGAGEDDVTIEILSTPRSGLLGLGARRAKVRVTRRPEMGAHSQVMSPQPAAQRRATAAPLARPSAAPKPARAPEAEKPAAPERIAAEPESEQPDRPSGSLEEQSREAAELVADMLKLMEEPAEVALGEQDAEGISIEIKGDGSGILIGRHGQTLDAMEYLVNRVLARRTKNPVPVILDVAAYRARRRQQLERMALSMGERAKRERKPVALEPMPPRDRRVVHLALKDDPLITTRSVGNGYLRSLEILPSDVPSQPPERELTLERPRSSSENVGQQGGFKRGQKRIL